MLPLHFLKDQLDYIFFFYGLSFIILAVICSLLARRQTEKNNLPWNFLAAFGLVHGINEWLNMTAIDVVENDLFSTFRTAIMALSFLFLFEFGRRGLKNLNKIRLGPWIYVPLGFLASIGAMNPPSGLNTTLRYFIALPASFLAAWVFLSVKKGSPAQRTALKLSGAFFFLYAFASGFVVSKTALFPSCFIHYDSFMRAFGFPVQLLRGLLTLGAAISLWHYFDDSHSDKIKAKLSFGQKIRGQALVPVLLLILSAGWIFTQYLGERAKIALRNENESDVEGIAQYLELNFSKVDQMAQSISGAPYLPLALYAQTPENLAKTNSLIDRYQKTFEISVCYLMDVRGTVVTSTNRNEPDSFVGQSYAIRPYFQKALAGELGRYLAVGLTSKLNGYYAAYPVKNDQGTIIGVVAFKLNLSSFMINQHHPTFLTDRHGVILVSSKPHYDLHTLWPVDAATRKQLIESQQFGQVLYSPLLSKEIRGQEIVSLDGNPHCVFRREITRDGWSVILLANARMINDYRLSGIVLTMFVCVLIIIFFYALRQKEESLEMIRAEALERKRAEQMLRAVFDNIPARVFWKDLDLIYRGCNLACAKDAGLQSPEAIIGKTDEQLSWADKTEQYRQDDREVIRTGRAKLNYEETAKLPDGSTIWVNSSKVPLQNLDGQITGVLGIYENITARKQAEAALLESTFQLQGIYDSMVDGLAIIDLETKRFVLVNDAFCHMLGYDRTLLLQKTPFDIHPPQQKNKISELIDTTLKNQGKIVAELPCLCADGKIIYADLIARAIQYKGRPCSIGFFRDATERKKVEDALRASEARYKSYLEVTGQIGWTTNAEGLVEDMPEWRKYTGQSIEAVKGWGWLNAIHPDDRPHTTEVWNKAVEAKNLYETEYRVRRHDGVYRHFLARGIPSFQEDGSIREWVGTCIDITERKKEEELLRETEAKYRTLYQSSKDAIMILEPPDWKFTAGNPATLEIFNIENENQFTSLGPWDLSPEHQPDGQLSSEKAKRMISLAMETGSHFFEWTHKKYTGEAFSATVLLAKMRMQGKDVLQATVRDITELKKAVEALREQEMTLRSITDSAQDAILMMDPEGRISFWNSAAEKIFGWSKEEAIGKNLHHFLAPERYHEAHDQAFPRFRETGRGNAVGKTLELHGLRKDKTEIAVELSLSAVHLRGQWHAVGLLRDITERKKIDLKLRKLQRGIEQSPATIVITDLEGTIEYVNPKFTELTGYTFDEAIGKNPRILKSGELPPERYRELWQTISAGKEWRGEFHNKKKNGELFWELASISPIRDANGTITSFIAIKEDITERKRIEEELARSNAELEQFAYIASHDLQEPLRMVTSYVQLLNKRYAAKLDQNAQDFMGFAVDGAMRMHTMINDLLEYSRIMRKGIDLTATDLELILKKTLMNLQLMLEENKVTITHDPLPVVRADATQMIRLFQNLIANAVKFRSARPVEIHIGAEERAREWLLTVRDNGIGFEQQYADRIFVIFQRLHTRSEYPGSGIGLSVCKKIVDRHGGHIWAQSEPGAGATFYFTIPK